MARRQRPFWPIERISASRSYLAGSGANSRCAKRLPPAPAGSVMGVSSWLAGFQLYALITASACGKITAAGPDLARRPGPPATRLAADQSVTRETRGVTDAQLTCMFVCV